MNLLQRMQKLSADWHSEIERRKEFLLPLGEDLQSCLSALDKEIAYGAFASADPAEEEEE